MSELLDKYLEEVSDNYDLVIDKIDSFTEAVSRTLEINYMQAWEKVADENGTDEAITQLYEAATSEMAANIRAALDKNAEALKKFFSDTQEKILKTVTDAKTKETVADIKKKAKLLPLLGRKKIMVENYNAEAKLADKAMSNLVKLKAKIKGGQEVTSDDVAKVEKNYRDEHEKLVGVSEAVSVTVNNAISVMDDMSSDAAKMISKTRNEATGHIEDLKKMADKAKDPRSLQALARAFANIAKSKISDFVRCFSNIANTIKKSIKGFSTKTDAKETKESTDDSMDTPDMKDIDTKDLDSSSSDSSDVAKEDGDDPGVENPSEQDPMDSVADDPWASIINDLGLDGTDTECGDNCGNECDTTSESATDSFEALYKKIVGDAAPSPSDDASLGGKPSNDKLIADIFKDIEAEVKGHVPEYKPAAPIKESAFSQLMTEIEEL